MYVSELARWLGLLLEAIPLLIQAMWYWNDVRFLASLKLRSGCGNNIKLGGGKLPPGHMGLHTLPWKDPLSFLWYYKILRRFDDYIHSKRNSQLRFFASDGRHLSLLAMILSSMWRGNSMRGSGFMLDAINQPDSLRRIARMVQLRTVSALQCWAEKGTVNALLETSRVCLFHSDL